MTSTRFSRPNSPALYISTTIHPLPNEEAARLLACYIQGDEQAFARIFTAYQPRLYAFMYYRVGDRQRAEDLVQETFFRVAKHAHRFDPEKKFSTWIYTIATNLAANEHRNYVRNRVLAYHTLRKYIEDEDTPFEFADPKAAADKLLLNDELSSVIWRGINTLIPHHRRVFILREIDCCTYDTIAAITRASLGTVKSRLNRARIAFALAVEPWLN